MARPHRSRHRLPRAERRAAYPWPFKPFTKQHPIRGFFGDPRTVYLNGVLSGGFEGPGFFSFHQGIDISAPDGTPIYPVMSGTAHYLGAATLNIDAGKNGAGDEVVFQYFHIVPVVGEGDQVVARKTILGYVQPPFQHVHLTEINGTHSVNPLQPGHLAPYTDHTRPTIREVSFRNQTGTLQTPLGLCGRVELAVDAYDTPPVPVPGKFRGLPVAPALVRWNIARLNGTGVVPWRTPVDFRTIVPGNGALHRCLCEGHVRERAALRQPAVHVDAREVSLPARRQLRHDLARERRRTCWASASPTSAGTRRRSRERFSVLNARNGVCPGSLPAPPTTEPPPTEPPGGSSGTAAPSSPSSRAYARR